MKEYKLTPNEAYDPDVCVEPVMRVYKLGEEPKETTYWLSRPPVERLAMIEELRREFYGEEYDLSQEAQELPEITVRKLR